jgi:hypothetical protein
MKTRELAGCAALLTAVILGGCAMSLGEEELVSNSRNVAIAGEDLRPYIAQPLTGATPVFSFPTSTSASPPPPYTGIVVWTPTGGVFEPYTEYTAVVMLQANSGYDFTGMPARTAEAEAEGSFSYFGSKAVRHGPGSGGTLTISIDFNPTGPAEIDYDLQRYVPIPVAGAAPARKLELPELNLTARWWDGERAPFNGEEFEINVAYQAELTLTAKYPYRFDPDRPFAYPEVAVDIPPDPTVLDIEERKLSVTYYPTKASQTVSEVDLAPYIPVPVAGETAARDFVAERYRGTVVWKLLYSEADLVGTTMPGNLFQPEALYRADVALYALPGFTLAGASFAHSGGTLQAAGSLSMDGSSRTGLKIAFPKTGKLVISDLDLTLKVPRPVNRGIPVTTVSESQYAAETTVIWEQDVEGAWAEMEGDAFKPGTIYRVVFTLTAAPGYTFAGIPEKPNAETVTGAFSHAEGTVTHGEGTDSTLAISVDFPATTSDEVVNDLDLTLKVPQPVNGGDPVTKVVGTQYAMGAIVTWYAWATGQETHSGAFQPGTVYRAEFTLAAASGYTFDGIGATSQSVLPVFTHDEGTVSHEKGAAGAPIKVTVTFPATEVPPPPSFGPADLDGSALNLMEANKNDDSWSITLSPGTEDLAAGTVIRWTAAAKNTPRSVTIDGGGRELQATGAGQPLITLVGNGSSDPNLTFLLKNITIRGKSGLNAPLVKVTGRAKLILGSGAILEENQNNATDEGNYGGAVHVASGSFLEMRVGSFIRENRATVNNANPVGGVYVGVGGKFTMNGGVLSGNEAASDKSAGGVYAYGTGAVVVMNGGDIMGNTSAGDKGAGGLSFEGGTFTMTGGRISVNTAEGEWSGGGVSMSGGTFTMSGGEISGNTAAGVDSAGGVRLDVAKFTMNDGVISGNNAGADNSTGGVQVYDASFTMNNGSISGNTAGGAASSGGVIVQGSAEVPEFLMKGGKIINNTVSGAGAFGIPSAGGVLIRFGTFTMTRGEISNNTAAAGDSGGGVGIYGTSTSVKMTDGLIHGNTAKEDNSAGGVQVSGGTFEMSGGSITGNVALGAVDISGGVRTTGAGVFDKSGGGTVSGNTPPDGP